MRKINFKLGTCFLISLLFLSPYYSERTHAEEKKPPVQESSAQKIKDNFETYDPHNMEALDLNKETINNEVAIESNPEKGIVLKNKEDNIQDIQISIPYKNELEPGEVVDNTMIYSNNNIPVSLGIQVVDGGLRQLISIESMDAPKEYEFQINTSELSKLVLNKDGSASLLDENGEVILAIAKPWAIDANNTEIPTYYEVKDNKLIQHVNFEKAQLPVIADPLFCSKFISKGEWITRGTGKYKLSLSLTPTHCGRLTSFTYRTASFNEVKKKFSSSKNWSNTEGMKDQFLCHADAAPPYIKDKWNLEPKRPNVGYWSTVKALCNPS